MQLKVKQWLALGLSYFGTVWRIFVWFDFFAMVWHILVWFDIFWQSLVKKNIICQTIPKKCQTLPNMQIYTKICQTISKNDK